VGDKLVSSMVFNATFHNISVKSLRSVLLVVETGGPGEYHRPVASHFSLKHVQEFKNCIQNLCMCTKCPNYLQIFKACLPFNLIVLTS
jgi:hypothetical protein